MDKNIVLIVDDESSNIIALTKILCPEYDVYAAKNGSDAIMLAKEHLPDVILLDVHMPAIDGYEIISVLKGAVETRALPVIFITDIGSTDAEEKGMVLGASDYIVKPFHASIVKLRIQNQIQFSSQYNIVKALSLTDELTGLYNRRGFDYRLRMELNRAKREHTPISVLMIDIDNFNQYNDMHGHMQGDEALQTITRVIKKTLKRSIDFSARWGGEEFIALLPDTDLSGALGVAERVRANIENTNIISISGADANVTVSVGVQVFMPSKDISVQDFISGASRALDAAKASGRNRVCGSDE